MMGTQLEAAAGGLITAAMKAAARAEGVSAEAVRRQVESGRAVIPCNPAHKNLRPAVVGRAFRTKVNANIGRSPEVSSARGEMRKLLAALEAGADTVMDLSVGAGLGRIRRRIIAGCPVPVGTVPIYEAFCRADGRIERLDSQLILDVIAEQAEEGVDFMTLHAGVLRRMLPLAMRRKLGIVSRGGAIIARWMCRFGRENPLYERWSDVLEICRRHDVTVSLGDGLRPGCQADASDAAQFAELETLGELVRISRRAGVQAMVEGPGHIPFDQIEMNIRREQKICSGAPFYVLGPVVTDVAPGYDHISAAIGATAAAFYGASLLCYVTPSEHLGLPTAEEVRTGVVAFRIAAHAADIALGIPGARQRDDAMAEARMKMDWRAQFRLALDGRMAAGRFRKSGRSIPEGSDHCTMCGRDFCAVRASREMRRRAK